MVGVCLPFLATSTQGWMSAHCGLPPPPPSIYPDVAVESANSSRRRLRKPTPTPQYPCCPALTVLHKWLINGWMQTPNELKQQREFPPSSSIFINSTQSPALPKNKRKKRKESSGGLRTALLPDHCIGQAKLEFPHLSRLFLPP